jgi:hypothetical protein
MQRSDSWITPMHLYNNAIFKIVTILNELFVANGRTEQKGECLTEVQTLNMETALT